MQATQDHEQPGAGTRAKTYKRELATLLILMWAIFVTWGVHDAEAREASRFMTLPIFTFAGGAFGLDALAKQLR